MNYYDNAIRKRIEEQLRGYRSMLEQAMINASDQNYHILAAERIKQIDELLKIIKPSPFDFLSKKEMRKIQESNYLKQKEAEIRQSYEEKLEKAKQDIRDEIERKNKKQRLEKKKRKKQKREAEELLPHILKKIQNAGNQQEVRETEKSDITENQKSTRNAETDPKASESNDDFPDETKENIE